MALGARLRFSAPSIAYGARYSVGARLRFSAPFSGLAYASAPLL